MYICQIVARENNILLYGNYLKECINMILIIILTLIALLVCAFVVTAVVVGGSAFVVVFADAIVCAAILIWIIRKLINRRR